MDGSEPVSIAMIGAAAYRSLIQKDRRRGLDTKRRPVCQGHTAKRPVFCDPEEVVAIGLGSAKTCGNT